MKDIKAAKDAIRKRIAKKTKIATLGDFRQLTKDMPDDMPLEATQYIDRKPFNGDGTDMSSDEECVIEGVVDLETRVVIQVTKEELYGY